MSFPDPAARGELPAAVRLRPHHPLLDRTVGSMQFGMAHRGGIEVLDLSAPLAGLLRLLPERVGWPVLDLVEAGVRLGADPTEVCALLTELYVAGALLDDGAALRLASARRSAYVLVAGSGPLLAPMLTGLGTAGVGRLGVDPGDRSVPLVELRDELGRVAPRSSLEQPRPRTRVDLVVVTDPLSPGRGRNPELELTGVPRLVARVSDGSGLVGPLVLPGRTACTRCLDLHRADQDPYWPEVSAQLGRLEGSADPATVQATAALAVEQALLGLDALVAPVEPPPTLDAVLELDLRRGLLHRHRWPPHPECGCGAYDTALLVPVPTPATSDDATRGDTNGTPGPTGACVASGNG